MYKKILFLLFVAITTISCHKDNFNNSNPYLANYGFSTDVNMSLPLYNNLQFASNSVKVSVPNGPINGIIVFNTGSGYLAYDGSCPNQTITSCSKLTLSGINATCGCDNSTYNLFTGQCAGKQYPLKPYRVEVNGNVLRVYN
ncbi:hypothetical protein OX284_011240 [Flavobacterium sp. SUN046]|uniref:Rieske (2Fe-2S) protein n=1 Tax=Flavobacterium sp. SUN046 TaxID=3002440 RepID=UPI002DBBE628|nr:hypothetical protein [Flavobacterium sp. SUN046]MEC4050005.1 hypothetical protein [Flavobacterium sp. SUN046]